MPKQTAVTVVDEYYSEALEKCSRLVASSEVSVWKRIKANFALGLQVEKLASDARYGDGVVKRLAIDISLLRKKQVFESSLYECRVVATYFGKLEAVKQLYDASATDVTWGSLVAGVRKEKEQKELEEKVKTRSPQYLIFIRCAKSAMRKLKSYLKRETVTDELRLELKIALEQISKIIFEILQALSQKPNSRQIHMKFPSDDSNSQSSHLN